MHVYLMYWSPKPSHKFKYGALELSSLETLSKYTTNYRQPLTITLLTLIIYCVHKVLQAACGGINLLKAYLFRSVTLAPSWRVELVLIKFMTKQLSSTKL